MLIFLDDFSLHVVLTESYAVIFMASCFSTLFVRSPLAPWIRTNKSVIVY